MPCYCCYDNENSHGYYEEQEDIDQDVDYDEAEESARWAEYEEAWDNYMREEYERDAAVWAEQEEALKVEVMKEKAFLEQMEQDEQIAAELESS